MGRIKKTASERHEATSSPYTLEFVQAVATSPLHKLPQHLQSFPRFWPFPRGDLYHWINVLNRFDEILEQFVTEYGLDKGPQIQPFEQRLLRRQEKSEHEQPQSDLESTLSLLGPEGDRVLVESILSFTQLLFDKCGNRSLYASSSYLNNLLNTTSLSLLKATLDLSLCLAQRFHASRARMPSPHLLHSLLASQYGLNTTRIKKMAQPFQKRPQASSTAPSMMGKGKERSSQTSIAQHPADINMLLKEDAVPPALHAELATVSVVYYDRASAAADSHTASESPALPALVIPATPTPAARTPINLTPSTASRRELPFANETTIETPVRTRNTEKESSNGAKTVEIAASEVAGKPSWQVLKDHLHAVPEEFQYELLQRVRVAKAFQESKFAIEQLVAVRLLSVANLAYVYGEVLFAQHIGQADSELPRELQLAQQLTDLLQPPTEQSKHIPHSITICALKTLLGLSKNRSGFLDVTTALNTSVSHGIFFYVLKSVVTSIETAQQGEDVDEWRQGVLDLADSLSQSQTHQRIGEQMMAAGLMGVLVDLICIRNEVALRFYPTVLKFFDGLVYNGVRDAFQSLVMAKGLDKIADLTGYAVQSAHDAVENGSGIPLRYKTKLTDYAIPFYEQQTLRLLFKFIAHMFHHNLGVQDRLLRNLVDSPQTLGALKTVITRSHTFGSNIWSGAINIVSNFIHSEPTSYNVISEAGLTKAILDSITGCKPAATPTDEQANLAEHILPVGETMRDIPTAFGAICLNDTGLQMFQDSKALNAYMGIFTSTEHVKALDYSDASGVATSIGRSFDELVRHHPSLRDDIHAAMIETVKSVIVRCNTRAAKENGPGAKLWYKKGEKDTVAGGRPALRGLSASEMANGHASKLDSPSAMQLRPLSPAEVQDQGIASVQQAAEESAYIEAEGLGAKPDGDQNDELTAMITTVCKFLVGYFSHGLSHSSKFCEDGGAELILDLMMVPSLPHAFYELGARADLVTVLEILVQSKPHLVLPSLAKRTTDVLNVLKPLINHDGEKSFFSPFTSTTASEDTGPGHVDVVKDGTFIVKALVIIRMFCKALAVILGSLPPAAPATRSTFATYFKLVNLTDMYVDIVNQLGKLHSACIWEEIAMQNNMPKAWNDQTHVSHSSFDNFEANEIMGGGSLNALDTSADNKTAVADETAPTQSTAEAFNKTHSASLKNTVTLRYLLSKTPAGISDLFIAMGRNLLGKRTMDTYQKTNAEFVALLLAQAVIEQLKAPVPKYIVHKDNSLPYHIVILSSTMQVFVDKSVRSGFPAETLVLVLQQFYFVGGFDVLNGLLKLYCGQVKSADDVLRQNVIGQILEFYAKIASHKSIEDAGQARALTSSASSNPTHSVYWTAGQVIVEIRDAIIDPVADVWNNNAEQLMTRSVQLIINVLRSVLEAQGESAATHREEQRDIPRLHRSTWRPRNHDFIESVIRQGEGVPRDRAVQALYRCAGDMAFADEYCRLRHSASRFGISVPWYPPADDEIAHIVSPPSLPSLTLPVATTPPVEGNETAPALERVPSVEMQDADQAGSDGTTSDTDNPSPRRRLPADILTDGLSELLHNRSDSSRDLLMSTGLELPPILNKPEPKPREPVRKRVTVEDLDDKRTKTRESLIDRSLDMIANHDITFDLADLIIAAYRSRDDNNAITDVGRTLVQVLISLRADEGEEVEAKKLGACAHLLALVLQEPEFYRVIEEHLKETFDDLLSLVRLNSEQKLENASYISHVLLILERFLAEDESPSRIQWQPPVPSNPLDVQSPIVLKPWMVTDEQRSTLFDAIMELVPKVGKDEAMALSFTRMLVILTRRPFLSARLGEKRTIALMFMMIKQLAGVVNEKLQSTFLVLLRHVVETEDTVRRIMRAEIQKAFHVLKNTSRTMDTTAYTRSLYHLVIRNPTLFIEVTGELVRLTRWDSSQTPQALTLKQLDPVADDQTDEQKDESKDEAESGTMAKNTTVESTPKPKSSENTLPTQEVPEGVTRFLLKEMFSYKDVDDAEPKPEAKTEAESSTTSQGANADVEMTEPAPPVGDDTSTADTPEPTPASDSLTHSSSAKAASKAVFKAEEHPFFLYKCFLLQCLTELLASYNRSKVEFINFTPKADHTTSTPSKPRSGFLNYLLTSLIPVGTLNHPEDIAGRKKVAMSTWAISVVVALCQKTSETATELDFVTDGDVEEPELVFVRRFVLEHALKNFRDATTSTLEPPDRRYSRLQTLSDLFNRMLQGKSSQSGLATSQKQLGRLMYEKNFVSHLTAAIAEIDLDFPNARRAIKYILRPLKALTETVVELSSSSDSPLGGTTDEDEISSATSGSDTEAMEREETPDLFRHSTLGQFESRRDDAETGSDSGSEGDEDGDVDEEYEDEYGEYDEGMEYEDDEPEHDHGEVVSDEEDMGSMGEIEGLPDNVNMDLEIVMDDEDGDTGNEGEHAHDEEEEDDDDDDDDEDGHDEDMDEAMEEDDGGSDDGDDHDDDEIDWDFEATNIAERQVLESMPAGHFDTMVGVLDGDSEILDRLERGEDDGMELEMEGHGEFFENAVAAEEGGDGDQGEYDEEDEEVVYEPEDEADDDDDDDDDGHTGWDVAPRNMDVLMEYPNLRQRSHHHHHHHHHHGAGEVPGDTFSRLYGSSSYRSHRGQAAPRGTDDGLNPLLQRDDWASADRSLSSLRDITWSPFRGDSALGRGTVHLRGGVGEIPSFVSDLIDLIGPHARAGFYSALDGRGAQGGMSPVVITAGPGGELQLPGGLEGLPGFHIPRGRGPTAMTDLQNLSRPLHTSSISEPGQAVGFTCRSSVERWQDEARLLFGPSHPNKAHEIIEFILQLLTPAAMEAKRKRDKIEAERRAAEEKTREEMRAKQEAERKEREEKERKEREEREAREAAEAAERAQNQAAQGDAPVDGSTNVAEGSDGATAAAPDATAPEEPTERVSIMIRGRELNITNLGIDREYIEALPEDMREEVVMQQYAELRHGGGDTSAQPTQIDRDFLAALPPELQAELIRSESHHRQRREREEARARALASGSTGQAQPEEMNNADFMAMLPPALRHQVLMEADENTIAALPLEIQAEARALTSTRRAHRHTVMESRSLGRSRHAQADEVPRPRRPVIQILDKAGVATILCLMFVVLQGTAKTVMHGILSDVCKNTQNRAEVISILLSILQEGSLDSGALERSYGQLKLRSKQTAGNKTPQPSKRGPPQSLGDVSPVIILGHCLFTLWSLVRENPRVSSFFLSEHETISSQRSKATKKGKGKETRASKYPINALLALLDRPTIIDNATILSNLANLLVKITEPLKILLKRSKEAEKSTQSPSVTRMETDTQPEPSMHTTADAQTSVSAAVPGVEATASSEIGDVAMTGTSQPEASTEQAESTSGAQDKKKPKHLAPPEIPEENLCLVVNILAARECPSKTFQNTLEIINHLAAIPRARDVFGAELVRRAQELGVEVLEDLAQLPQQIKDAKTSTDVQGMTIAKFSPGSSHQNKLLRMLVVLDYIYDPRRSHDRVAKNEKHPQTFKESLVSTLYESETFIKLWDLLSDCLATLRLRGNMNNIATILQPLIESFMVVCKNTASLTGLTSESSMGTPAPESRIAKLFIKFTEEHRKILNDLVRHNPKLMSGTFDVLVKNPKVLEFDNKRSYFNKRLRARPDSRVSHSTLQLSVRREAILEDSFKALNYKKAEELKYGKLNIRFRGEEGVDAGGVTREWFAAMTRAMFNVDLNLFESVASDKTTFHPSKTSGIANGDIHLAYFKFIGRIIGKALYEGRVLDCHFSRAVYKKILGKPTNVKDMESLDLDYYKSLCWILENDITDVTFETFSVENHDLGSNEIIDLVPGGRDIQVTEENKVEYVNKIVEQRLTKSVDEQLNHFLAGFHEIVPAELIAVFDEQELELLISGLPEIDIDDWKNNTNYQNYTQMSPQVQWFWRAVRSFDKEERAKLLQFITGTSKVPLNGFKELEGMNGFAKFSIHRDFGSTERLPSSHTCFNQLDLPAYETYESLRSHVHMAITAGSDHFGFA